MAAAPGMNVSGFFKIRRIWTKPDGSKGAMNVMRQNTIRRGNKLIVSFTLCEITFGSAMASYITHRKHYLIGTWVFASGYGLLARRDQGWTELTIKADTIVWMGRFPEGSIVLDSLSLMAMEDGMELELGYVPDIKEVERCMPDSMQIEDLTYFDDSW